MCLHYSCTEPSEVKKGKPAILVQAEAQPQGTVEVTLEVRGKDLEIASISEAPSIYLRGSL